MNSIFLTASAENSFAIFCNVNSSQNIFWVQTINKTGVYYVQNNNRVFTTNNGLYLNFTKIQLIDEEYYACAYNNSNNQLMPLKSFNLYVKGNFI